MKKYLSEEEIQVLIALLEVKMPIETPHNNHYSFYPKSVAEASNYFHHNLLPWDSAYITLLEKQLITKQKKWYRLTCEGARQADILRKKRPPIYYWYQTFYRAIQSSQTFARFCEHVYGINWEQHGFCDIQQIQFLLDQLSLCSQHNVLELGCGTGKFTEYLSDRFDVTATGIDYCEAAIELSRKRTQTKRDRLSFHVQHIDEIYFPMQTFDAIIAIDSLGFVSDMGKTIIDLYEMIKDNGTLAIFWFAITEDIHIDCNKLKADSTAVAHAFQTNGIAYSVYDFSEENWRILQARHATACKYKEAFFAEGNQFLFENLLMESEKGTIPFCEDTCPIRRFLYIAKNEKKKISHISFSKKLVKR